MVCTGLGLATISKSSTPPAVSDDWSALAFSLDRVARRAEKRSRERPEHSRTDAIMQLGQGAAGRKEIRDDKKNRDRAVQSDDFQAI
jgi:hypothetical protein